MKNTTLSFLLLLTLFAITEASPPNSYKIFIGDFDGNNKADFIRQRTSNSNASNLNVADVFYNPIAESKPFALSKNFLLNGDYTNLLIGDFNGDGRDDILRQEKGAWDDDKINTVFLLLSTTCGCRFEKIILPEEWNLGGDGAKLYVGDFDGDGNDDFLRQDLNLYTAYVFLSNGNGEFNKIVLPDNFDLVGVLTNLYIGDFDGDGMDDILRQEKNYWDDNKINTAYLLLSTGQGTFEKIILSEDYNLGGDSTNLFIGDFDGDGKDDVLRQEKKTQTAHLLLSTGRGFKKILLSVNFNMPGDLTNLFIGDFDGDGKDDVLRQEKNAWDDDKVNTAYLLLSDGKESFKKIVLSEDLNIKGDETTLYVGDFNKDGKSDFLKYWGNDLTTIYLSNGNGQFTKV